MIKSETYDSAIALLHHACTLSGFVAAVQEHDNYRRIWTRDGTITSIAALLSGDTKLIACAKATIQTIFNHQHPSGFMPSNVSPIDGAVSYGNSCGRADNPSWAVIGLCAYTLLSGDDNLWNKYLLQIQRCFAVLDAWEFNGKHLVYVPQSGDWADEYIQHGYILFDQLLRLWALRLANKIAANAHWEEKSQQIVATVQNNYWNVTETSYAPHLLRLLESTDSQFWLMGFNPSRIYPYFDLQANSFALLLGLGNQNQNTLTVNYLEKMLDDHFLLPSFYPTIDSANIDMRELKDNHAYAFRNFPHQFHNGGLWPVWNGWLAAALAHVGKFELAKKLITHVHLANTEGTTFNECLHGQDLTPCGVANCVWSAAGAIIAEQSLHNKKFRMLFNFY